MHSVKVGGQFAALCLGSAFPNSDIPVSLAHTDKVDTHDSSCAQ